MRCMRAIVLDISSACLSMSSIRARWNGKLSRWLAFDILSMNGTDECSICVPSGRVMDCTFAMPGTANTALASRLSTSRSAELRIS
ncbi:Uncharacterised protein [Mycobacteroides abscessus subsp. abscessus]|nr:Uncharacterised protein [Mycobacteroides abscessus subsp. abscessus]